MIFRKNTNLSMTGPAILVKCVTRHPVFCAYHCNTCTFGYQIHYFMFVLTEYVHLRRKSLLPAEHLPFRLAQSERLLGAKRYEISLDFGDQAECEAQDLAVYAVVEAVSFLGRVYVYTLLEAFPHDGHYVCKGPAEP